MNNSDGYEERAGEEGKGGVGREEEELKSLQAVGPGSRVKHKQILLAKVLMGVVVRVGGVGVGWSRGWPWKRQRQGPVWGQRQGQRTGGLGCHGAPQTLSKRLWEVRRAVIRGVMKADFRKGLHDQHGG